MVGESQHEELYSRAAALGRLTTKAPRKEHHLDELRIYKEHVVYIGGRGQSLGRSIQAPS